MTITFPTSVQAAIDYGRSLPGVTVLVDDLRGIPSSDTIDIDFLFSIPGDSVELGTVWSPDPNGWALIGGSWRTFSRQDHSSSLDTWDDVRAFLDNHATVSSLTTTPVDHLTAPPGGE